MVLYLTQVDFWYWLFHQRVLYINVLKMPDFVITYLKCIWENPFKPNVDCKYPKVMLCVLFSQFLLATYWLVCSNRPWSASTFILTQCSYYITYKSINHVHLCVIGINWLVIRLIYLESCLVFSQLNAVYYHYV